MAAPVSPSPVETSASASPSAPPPSPVPPPGTEDPSLPPPATASRSPTPTASPTSTETFAPTDDPPPELMLIGEDFDAVIRSYHAYRDWVFMHPDPDRLDAIMHPECECIIQKDLLAHYVDQGQWWVAEPTVVRSVESSTTSPPTLSPCASSSRARARRDSSMRQVMSTTLSRRLRGSKRTSTSGKANPPRGSFEASRSWALPRRMAMPRITTRLVGATALFLGVLLLLQPDALAIPSDERGIGRADQVGAGGQVGAEVAVSDGRGASGPRTRAGGCHNGRAEPRRPLLARPPAGLGLSRSGSRGSWDHHTE